MIEVRLRKRWNCIGTLVGFETGAAAEFLRNNRTDAGVGCIDCLGKLHRLYKDCFGKFFLGGV